MVHQIADRVRKMDKPQSMSIGLPTTFRTCILNVVDADGTARALKISRLVAEVLIASGFPHEG